MSATSIISREVITFSSSVETLNIPAGTNEIWFRKLSDDAVLTVMVNGESADPAADAELYQVTNEEAVMVRIPFYTEMESLVLTSPAGSSCHVEFRRR